MKVTSIILILLLCVSLGIPASSMAVEPGPEIALIVAAINLPAAVIDRISAVQDQIDDTIEGLP